MVRVTFLILVSYSRVTQKVPVVMTDAVPPFSYRPELPDWGVYLYWPTDGEGWIHPDDIAVAKQLIPSSRVFHRLRWDGEFYHLRYGQLVIRVRPSLWLPVLDNDLEVGQQVEVLSRLHLNDPGIFRIADIRVAAESNVCEYSLHGTLLKLEKRFRREDLRPLHIEYHLRVGYYQHPTPSSQIPADMELLNVGDLTSQSE